MVVVGKLVAPAIRNRFEHLVVGWQRRKRLRFAGVGGRRLAPASCDRWTTLAGCCGGAGGGLGPRSGRRGISRMPSEPRGHGRHREHQRKHVAGGELECPSCANGAKPSRVASSGSGPAPGSRSETNRRPLVVVDKLRPVSRSSRTTATPPSPSPSCRRDDARDRRRRSKTSAAEYAGTCPAFAIPATSMSSASGSTQHSFPSLRRVRASPLAQITFVQESRYRSQLRQAKCVR